MSLREQWIKISLLDVAGKARDIHHEIHGLTVCVSSGGFSNDLGKFLNAHSMNAVICIRGNNKLVWINRRRRWVYVWTAWERCGIHLPSRLLFQALLEAICTRMMRSKNPWYDNRIEGRLSRMLMSLWRKGSEVDSLLVPRDSESTSRGGFSAWSWAQTRISRNNWQYELAHSRTVQAYFILWVIFKWLLHLNPLLPIFWAITCYLARKFFETIISVDLCKFTLSTLLFWKGDIIFFTILQTWWKKKITSLFLSFYSFFFRILKTVSSLFPSLQVRGQITWDIFAKKKQNAPGGDWTHDRRVSHTTQSLKRSVRL